MCFPGYPAPIAAADLIISTYELGPLPGSMTYIGKSTPCPQCGRTHQTPGHQTCDGCGAPR